MKDTIFPIYNYQKLIHDTNSNKMPQNCLDFYTQEEIANPKTLTRRNLLDSMKQKNTGHLTLPTVAKVMKENSDFQINVRSRSIRHKT